ncbi:protein-L-isoaspartate O-methyltransferase family protein [Nocardioides mangrovi]|uniref:Protein-L-isoaspartate O-methyltransferase n=1 Tax=Nocardioides mangrovi TaxID=2874580 RepID=A0ABS7UB18_9ACTN|nr:methyltransferase domain-containing protein [Nocardioides mangrovi]MBZ5738035.1 protein-L-isoaspartate O-methyltransferase [Nocardioides mangrovi]
MADPDRVADAFRAAPRVWFLPAGERHRAAYDGPIPIGHEQTSSQPRTVEAMLRLLDVRAGQRVLDVGSGSGWTTALLAALVGPDGTVLGLERVPELVAFGRENLARGSWPWARIDPADPDRLGDPAGAPYDRVLVSAEAGELPGDLVTQLAPDGRMVIPVRGEMLLVEPTAGAPRVTTHGRYRFVPLR